MFRENQIIEKTTILEKIQKNNIIENSVVMSSLRGRLPMSTNNNSRNSSIISKASSKLYYECMEIQSINPMWADQVEDEYNSCFLYTNVGETNISNGSVTGNNPKGKQCNINEALALNNMLLLYKAGLTNS